MMPRALSEKPVEGGTMTCWDCQMVWDIGTEMDDFWKHQCIEDSYDDDIKKKLKLQFLEN